MESEVAGSNGVVGPKTHNDSDNTRRLKESHDATKRTFAHGFVIARIIAHMQINGDESKLWPRVPGEVGLFQYHDAAVTAVGEDVVQALAFRKSVLTDYVQRMTNE